MLPTRVPKFALSALAVAVGVVLTAADAGGAPPPKQQAPAAIPVVAEGIPVDALASLAPAIVGAVAANVSAPEQQHLLDQARSLLNSVALPPPVKATLQGIVTFLDGSGGGGPAMPGDGPAFAQFLYPTVGRGCIGPQGDSVGTALAVPGPADIPSPGPQAGQTAFVLTALGTGQAMPQENSPMTVQWLNLDTQRGGVQPLTDEAHLNPLGPATLSAIADTGRGRVVAVISGSLTTHAAAGQAPITCSFLPTMGFFTVG